MDRLAIVAVVITCVAIALLSQSRMIGSAATAMVGNIVSLEVPHLDDPAMVRRGASHYDRVCARCHASPERTDQAEAREISPSPPRLHLRVEGWPPEALFAIVRNGVPRSGMPAWPAPHRDDEIWAMVAFLLALPDMDATSYRAAAGLDPLAVETSPLIAQCARCHGADGGGVGSESAFPRLDIQHPEYLYDALRAFRDGRRSSGFMQSAVAGFKDEELSELANHFAGGQKGAGETAPTDLTLEHMGARMPACIACHGTTSPARPAFPRLSGQHESYLLAQLELFRAGKRGGGSYFPLMHEVADRIDQLDLTAVVKWFAAQP